VVIGASHKHAPTPKDAGHAQDSAPLDEPELASIAQETSDTERRAAEAERELVEWKKIKFMRERVGEDFDGLILSATKYGLFVELQDLFIEGLVPIQSLGALDGDRYSYRENTREIIGDMHGRKFRIGQCVRVLLDRVDAVEKRLQFSILLDGEDVQATVAKQKPAKSKSTKSPVKSPVKSKKSGRKERGAAEPGSTDGRPARAANPKKSGRKKRFRPEDVPAFAANVAQPPPRGHKKGRKTKKKTSMQQSGISSGPKPKIFHKKRKKH